MICPRYGMLVCDSRPVGESFAGGQRVETVRLERV